jgi:DNA-binding GntR family transcriptional regulator
VAPDPVTLERIYRALKDEYLSGAYHLGGRIDLQPLADRHRASVTPVREAIYRLIGERLFEAHPDGGFRIARPEPARLTHLYAWNLQHLLAALHVTGEAALRQALQTLRHLVPGTDRIAQIHATGMVFRVIGEATGNLEFAEQVEAANARLFYPRLAEAMIFKDLVRESRALSDPGTMNVQKILRRRIIAYHRRRIEHVAQIALLLSPKSS